MSIASVAAPGIRQSYQSKRVEAASARRQRSLEVVLGRNASIDVMRLFAVAGVVYIHSAESPAYELWGNLFRFAVPFYLFASLYFQSLSLRLHRERTIGEFIGRRVKRLYLPFLAWSAIYLVGREIKHFAGRNPIDLQLSFLWKGTQYHLWFLPYLLAASIALAVIQRTLLRRDQRMRWLAIGVMIAVGIGFGLAPTPRNWSEVFDNPTYIYVEWWRSLPATCFAIAFAWCMTMGSVIYSVSPIIGAAGLLLALLASLKQVVFGIQTIPRGLTGLGCMLVALAPWRGRMIAFLAPYGRDGYGIYLSHVLFVQIVHLIASGLHLQTSLGLDLFTFAVSLTCSIVLVRLLARSKYTVWLNG